MTTTGPPTGLPPRTEPPLARTLNFGTSETASLLVKITITHGTNERRAQMIIFSLFDKLMRNEMPQNQEQLAAALLDEEQKAALLEETRIRPRN